MTDRQYLRKHDFGIVIGLLRWVVIAILLLWSLWSCLVLILRKKLSLIHLRRKCLIIRKLSGILLLQRPGVSSVHYRGGEGLLEEGIETIIKRQINPKSSMESHSHKHADDSPVSL